jgi:hypothetical protein
VNRSGTNEPMWVVIYITMEITQGISMYSYHHLKLAKTLYFSFLSNMLFLQQNQRTRGQNRFSLEGGRVDVGQIMYIHVSKYKNDKIKILKKTTTH